MNMALFCEKASFLQEYLTGTSLQITSEISLLEASLPYMTRLCSVTVLYDGIVIRYCTDCKVYD
jgi:hypothetical protein